MTTTIDPLAVSPGTTAPSTGRTALRLLAGIAIGVLVGVLVSLPFLHAGEGATSGTFEGLGWFLLALAVSIPVGLVGSVVAVFMLNRNDPERGKLTLSYALTLLGVIGTTLLSFGVFLPPLLVIVPLVVVKRLRFRWVVVSVAAAGVAVLITMGIVAHGEDQQIEDGLREFDAPLLAFETPTGYELEYTTLPVSYQGEPHLEYLFTPVSDPALRSVRVEVTGSTDGVLCAQVDAAYPPCEELADIENDQLLKDGSTYHRVEQGFVVTVDTDFLDEEEVRALLGSARVVTRADVPQPR